MVLQIGMLEDLQVVYPGLKLKGRERWESSAYRGSEHAEPGFQTW